MVCETDARGFATPENRRPLGLVVNPSKGFIRLWAQGVALRWRLPKASIRLFANPQGARTGLRELMPKALLLWEIAVPVHFSEGA